MKTVSALCIGEELLDGRTRDQNANWLTRASRDHGFIVQSIHIIGDAHNTIVKALEEISSNCDFLIVCGGLGPTADDITREAAAKWVDAPLRLDEAAFERLKQRFAERGYSYTPNNRSQCLFPEGAEVLASEVGTAAGFSLHKNSCTVTFLPGVPSEYRWFVQTHLFPQLRPDRGASDAVHRKRFVFYGAGESWLETKLDGIEEIASSSGARVSYLAKSPLIEIHLKASRPEAIAKLQKFVHSRVGKWLIAQGQESLEGRIGRILDARGATVTSAESCTGGQLSARFTSVSGASNWFERGFITYSNNAKNKAIGVDAQLIKRFGAVSPQVACQMAAGAQKTAGATFALAITGIAGPTGGTPDKPVGTVHFALAAADGVWHSTAIFARRTRAQVTSASVYTAMSLLLWHLEDHLGDHAVNGPFDAEQVWAAQGVEI